MGKYVDAFLYFINLGGIIVALLTKDIHLALAWIGINVMAIANKKE